MDSATAMTLEEYVAWVIGVGPADRPDDHTLFDAEAASGMAHALAPGRRPSPS